MRVRERPPLRHDIEVETPSGRRYRWAADEPRPENVPSGVRHSSTMPGGFENFDCALPRDPARAYPDLDRLSTVTVRHCGGEIVWEGRLERAPRTSGDRMSISPSAVGWQAHLEDDKSASMVYVDRDLGRWHGPGTQRRINYAGSGHVNEGTVTGDLASGKPALKLAFTGPWGTASGRPFSELWYDAGPGNLIASAYRQFESNGNPSTGDGNFDLVIWAAANDGSVDSGTGDLWAAGLGGATFTPPTPRRYLMVVWSYQNVAAGGTNVEYAVYWKNLAVFGDHGLTKRGTAPNQGLYASDIVAHAVAAWAPFLKTTAAGESTINTSAFVIPHLPFYDPTTAAEIVNQATRFELLDWAVWENKTFWLHERGVRGRSWRARVGPAQLEETGPQVDRVWESIIVAYRDVDGSTRTVGPPGSGADTESADLQDDDPQNPAVQLGITRRDLLQMGTSTAAAATEVGRRFLEEANQLDSSGRARVVGYVEDDRGVLHPYSHVRAGDDITFVDAEDQSARRIVKADHNHDERTCSVDLDAPPEGMQALLERLGVALVPLGLS